MRWNWAGWFTSRLAKFTSNVRVLFTSEALDGIKYELEALHGVKLMKLFDEKTLYLLCNNYGIKHNCKSYYAKFSI